MFLAARSLWTNFFFAKCFIPVTTSRQNLRSCLSVKIGRLPTMGLHVHNTCTRVHMDYSPGPSPNPEWGYTSFNPSPSHTYIATCVLSVYIYMTYGSIPRPIRHSSPSPHLIHKSSSIISYGPLPYCLIWDHTPYTCNSSDIPWDLPCSLIQLPNTATMKYNVYYKYVHLACITFTLTKTSNHWLKINRD